MELSSTLFGLYLDEVSNYIEGLPGSIGCLEEILGRNNYTQLIYSVIEAISDSPKELQTHLYLDEVPN